MEALVKKLFYFNQFCSIKTHSLSKTNRDTVYARLINLIGWQDGEPPLHVIGK